MTRDEALRPFKMLSANWPFIKFEEDVTFEMWFAALEPYLIGEVLEGVKRAIADLNHTPVVADVLVYVKDVHDGRRRIEDEAERNRPEQAAVECRECNDFGFITIIFPTGYEAVRPCRCRKAHQTFGKSILEKVGSEPLPEWKKEMLFGANEIPSQYKLVRVSRNMVSTGEMFKGTDKKMHERLTWAWGPYVPRGCREEVFMQYQKVRRK